MLLELALLLPVVLYAWHWWARGYWRRRNVFQIDGEFVFGSTGRALLSKVDFFKAFYDGIYRDHKEKKLIGFYSFFKPILIVTDIDYIKQIFITDFNSFPTAGIKLGKQDKLVQYNPFLHSGEQWKTLRGIHAQSMSPVKLKEYLPLMIKSGQSAVKYIEENISKPIKIADVMKLYTIDNITSAVFGLEPTAFKDPENGFRKHACDTVYDENMGMTWQFGKYAPFISILLRLRFLSKGTEEFFIDMAGKTFDFRQKNNATKNDLIEQLIKINQKRISEGKKGMDAIEVAGHMATTYIDAVDTTSIFLSYLFLELANRPEVQERLRDEIMAAGRRLEDFDSEKIHSLEYLNMVLNEVFRIHSVMSYFTRYCAQNTKLGDVEIEKGTTVIIPYSAIINDPEFFPEPEKFTPERFSPSSSSEHKGKFFPFGEGPKQCVGMRYATLQLKLACIALLLTYRLTSVKKCVGDKVPDSTFPFVFTKPDDKESIIFEKLKL